MGDNDVVGSSEGLLSVSTQEQGIRNKRKYLTDMLFDVPLDVSGLSLTEFPRYELLEEKLRNALQGALEARSAQPHGEEEVDEFQQAEWDDPLIHQLEELLSKNLFATFQSAIKKIIECGYDKQTAELLILRTGLLHGSKDAVSNIVDGALVLLKRADVFDASTHHIFENLQSLVEYTMLEMICVLREVKPSLTVAEAMWCLLICDLNLLHACAVNGCRLDGSHGQEIPEEKVADSTNAQSRPEASESRHAIPNEKVTSKPSDPRTQSCKAEIPKVGQASQLSNSRNPRAVDVGKTDKEGLVTLPEKAVKSSCITRENVQTLPQTSVAEEKSGGSRKGSSVNSKRDMLRQKTFHLEKSYKGRMSKGAFKAKFSALGNMVLDKTMKSTSSSSGVELKSTSSKITTVGANGPLSEEIHHHTSNSTSLLSAFDSPAMLPMKESAFASPAVNPQVPAPSAVEPKTAPETKANIASSAVTPDYYAGIPYGESLGKYVSQDENDKTMLLLIPHMQSMQKELQSWTDWANEKIMQATSRLSKDLTELRTLRQEKEEAEKFKKEKRTLEENTIKRLSEMEHAWSNANSQIEFANSSLLTLEAENSVLRQEMEAAKLQALGSATSLQEARRREQEALKNSQSWSLKKRLLQEEFTTLKRNAADLERQLEKADGRLKQIEALWKKEEKEKAEAFSKAKSMRERREQQEALLKAEEDEIRQKSESEVQKSREEIKKLETEISVLRFESESSRIAALRSGNAMDSKIVSAFLGLQSPMTNKRLEVFRDNFGAKSIKQERECVMCLSEEMSVVFLPCAHQVLCVECNMLHEKQRMKDCPSCRTLIQRRIQARFGNS